jgi:hypothetical protein
MEENSEANPSRESFLKKKMKRFHKKQKLKNPNLIADTAIYSPWSDATKS